MTSVTIVVQAYTVQDPTVLSLILGQDSPVSGLGVFVQTNTPKPETGQTQVCECSMTFPIQEKILVPTYEYETLRYRSSSSRETT